MLYRKIHRSFKIRELLFIYWSDQKSYRLGISNSLTRKIQQGKIQQLMFYFNTLDSLGYSVISPTDHRYPKASVTIQPILGSQVMRCIEYRANFLNDTLIFSRESFSLFSYLYSLHTAGHILVVRGVNCNLIK